VNSHSGYGDSQSMLLANHDRYEFVLNNGSYLEYVIGSQHFVLVMNTCSGYIHR
jgi:hypothetical protein